MTHLVMFLLWKTTTISISAISMTANPPPTVIMTIRLVRVINCEEDEEERYSIVLEVVTAE